MRSQRLRGSHVDVITLETGIMLKCIPSRRYLVID